MQLFIIAYTYDAISFIIYQKNVQFLFKHFLIIICNACRLYLNNNFTKITIDLSARNRLLLDKIMKYGTMIFARIYIYSYFNGSLVFCITQILYDNYTFNNVSFYCTNEIKSVIIYAINHTFANEFMTYHDDG